jgi:hypothetical protein
MVRGCTASPMGFYFLYMCGDKILFSKRVLLQHLPVFTYTGVAHESKVCKKESE